jgi:hypothetical protein
MGERVWLHDGLLWAKILRKCRFCGLKALGAILAVFGCYPSLNSQRGDLGALQRKINRFTVSGQTQFSRFHLSGKKIPTPMIWGGQVIQFVASVTFLRPP